MSQTKQQEQVASSEKPRARKDWEWFWRVVAGLMLVFIAWAGWVIYQITPRSVVTPLAYATPVKPIGTQQSAASAPASAVTAEAVAARISSGPSDAGQASAIAPTAAPSAAPATGADGQVGNQAVKQAGNQEKKEEQIGAGGLRLATEISTPPSGKQDNSTTQEGKTGRVPAGTGAAGKEQR